MNIRKTFRMNTDRSYLSVQLATAVILSLFTVSANAGLVESWWYETNATFTQATFTDAGSGGTNILEDDEISWGAFCGFGTTCADFTRTQSDDSSENRSALTIGSGTSDTKTGGGDASGTIALEELGQGSNITHWNNTIDADFQDLKSGWLDIELVLKTENENGAQAATFDLGFWFDFVETANQDDPCAGGETGIACPDLFRMKDEDALALINNQFTWDDQTYYVSILVTDDQGGASPVKYLTDGECAFRPNTGPGTDCRGWKTAEGQATTVQLAVKITTSPIPVPAPIALLGIGVLAMGFARRARTD